MEDLDHMRGTIKRSHYIEKLIEDHFEALKKTLDCETKQEPIQEVFNDERDVA
jgi:hypothetical protein